MKQRYDEFQVGEEVLVLLPFQGKPLTARYSGPYVVEKRVGEVDYIVKTPDRRKSHQLCHVNMLKQYHQLLDTVAVVQYVAPVVAGGECENGPACDPDEYSWSINDGAESTMSATFLQTVPRS
ncbi:hypothetical protein Pmani_016345 [Petrolisthes manimaculis]|uniref:Integrase p58-like C-terminal domain-containing protein n=1 Tax=Petrolisthes manimaculis TaxID=1843537 RepID=A0AAE1PPU9_9EUCA|nr:hypothetical protein Pmani_016345 [Petrolisthes manimaculis]